MIERKLIDPQRILIREFKITKGKIDCPDEFDFKNIESFSYTANLNTGFNLDEKLIRADFSVSVETVSKEKAEEANGSFHFVFIYHFEDLLGHSSLNESGDVDWNPYLANAIASITYSTSRGILLSRFQGTVLRDFILPVVDPNTLVTQKVSREKELK
jgi:hypothetical protein